MNHYRCLPLIRSIRRFEATAYVNAGELLLDIRVKLESGERSISLRGPINWERFRHISLTDTTVCGFAGHTRQSESFQQGRQGKKTLINKSSRKRVFIISSGGRMVWFALTAIDSVFEDFLQKISERRPPNEHAGSCRVLSNSRFHRASIHAHRFVRPESQGA